MQTTAAYTSKTHLSTLLARVAQGERITITRRGTPVAVLGPPESEPNPSVEEAIQSILELRKGNRLGGLSIRKMIEEGRR